MKHKSLAQLKCEGEKDISGRRFHVREMLTHMQFKEILKMETLKMNGAANKNGGGSFTVCIVPDTSMINDDYLSTLIKDCFEHKGFQQSELNSIKTG